MSNRIVGGGGLEVGTPLRAVRQDIRLFSDIRGRLGEASLPTNHPYALPRRQPQPLAAFDRNRHHSALEAFGRSTFALQGELGISPRVMQTQRSSGFENHFHELHAAIFLPSGDYKPAAG